jgi:hypothetical protein
MSLRIVASRSRCLSSADWGRPASNVGDAVLGSLVTALMLRDEVNIEVIITFSGRLTWVMAQRTRLESTSSHSGYPGGHDLFLEPSGFCLFVLIHLTLKCLDLACPFGETHRVRFRCIVCPSTSCSIHEEKRRSVVRAVADGGRQISHMS